MTSKTSPNRLVWCLLAGVMLTLPSAIALGAPKAAVSKASDNVKRALRGATENAVVEAEKQARMKATAAAIGGFTKATNEAKAAAKIEGQRLDAVEKGRQSYADTRKGARTVAKNIDETLIKWFPGWGVGVDLGWGFNGLNELNATVFEPNGVEPIDGSGMLRVEVHGDMYLTPKVQFSAFAGGMFLQGSETDFSLTYGGIAPALVFPERRFEIILGVKLGLGGYAFEGVNLATNTEGIGYSGLAGVIEPNLTLRYLTSRSIWIDFRLGFMQFLSLSSNAEGGAVDLGTIPGIRAGDTALDFAAPTFSMGFNFGTSPKRPKRAKVKTEESEEGEGAADEDEDEEDEEEGDDFEEDFEEVDVEEGDEDEDAFEGDEEEDGDEDEEDEEEGDDGAGA